MTKSILNLGKSKCLFSEATRIGSYLKGFQRFQIKNFFHNFRVEKVAGASNTIDSQGSSKFLIKSNDRTTFVWRYQRSMCGVDFGSMDLRRLISRLVEENKAANEAFNLAIVG